MRTPWHNQEGLVDFPYRALHDRVFIYPCPPQEKFGKEQIIEVPRIYRQYYLSDFGIILSVGLGYYSKDGKWHATDPELKPGIKVMFNKDVPWRTSVLGLDNKIYNVVVCSAADIWLIDNMEKLNHE